MKAVHKEAYKGYEITVNATFDDNTGVRISKDHDWCMGEVILSCKITDSRGKVNETFNTSQDYDIGSDKYQIAFQRKFNRSGFLNLKKEYYIVHIADEYNRVLPLFIERAKREVDYLAYSENKKKSNQEITDGLPDSLKNL
ncbi:hypothetical protein ABE073_04575 [Lederbergia citrisecunda]|uniref:hypothetical protein n=1 Tax=Lederbergia citrisecunda TaxID=2833583 RepID=UPI003D273496